jgi:hypothetical protein
MVRHRRSLFQRATIFEARGDPRRPEAMIAEFGFDAGSGRTPADHCISIRLR